MTDSTPISPNGTPRSALSSAPGNAPGERSSFGREMPLQQTLSSEDASLADEDAVASGGQPVAPGVWPSIRFTDAEAALEWLVEVIGFTEHAVYRGDDDRPVAHAELLWPEGGGIMLGSDAGEESWSKKVGAPGTSTIYLSSPHASLIFDRIVASQWEIIRPLTEQDYGSLEFAFFDPEGNAWSIGTYRGENF